MGFPVDLSAILDIHHIMFQIRILTVSKFVRIRVVCEYAFFMSYEYQIIKSINDNPTK